MTVTRLGWLRIGEHSVSVTSLAMLQRRQPLDTLGSRAKAAERGLPRC